MTCPMVCASLGPVEHDVHLPGAEGLIVLLINPADLPPSTRHPRCDRADGGPCLRAQYADGATWTPADTSCSQISRAPYSARFSSMNPSMSLIGGLAPPGRNTRSLSSRSRWRAAAPGSPTPVPGSAGHPHSSSPPEDHHQSPNASPRYATPQDGHQLTSNPSDRTLGPLRIPTGLQRQPSRTLTQLIGILPRTRHDSDPFQLSLPPSNTERFNGSSQCRV